MSLHRLSREHAFVAQPITGASAAYGKESDFANLLLKRQHSYPEMVRRRHQLGNESEMTRLAANASCLTTLLRRNEASPP